MRRIEVFLSAREVQPAELEERTVAVLDVIRATTVMVEALANGARAVIPVGSAEEAIKLAQGLGRDEALLCGERRGLKIEGFDLGNSPAEFTRTVVEGKRLIMSTTNGTQAFLAAEGAERTVVASLLNLSAAARAVAEVEDLAVVCAGKEGRLSLDDAVAAGLLLRRLGVGEGEDAELNDGARVVLHLSEVFEPTPEFLGSTAAGRALAEVGLESDLPLCARVDRYDLAPEMRERIIQLPEEPS